jgi:hypothetical protein
MPTVREPHGIDPLAAELLLQPALPLRDGRIIRSIADAVALVREHESRPGIDTRDEVLHQLERARTDSERQASAEAFFAWAKELDLLALPAKATTEQAEH